MSAMTPAAPCRISTAETTISCRTGAGSDTVAAISADRDECIARIANATKFGRQRLRQKRACRPNFDLPLALIPHVALVRHLRADRLAAGVDGRQRPARTPGAADPG